MGKLCRTQELAGASHDSVRDEAVPFIQKRVKLWFSLIAVEQHKAQLLARLHEQNADGNDDEGESGAEPTIEVEVS